jgi:hypothetical protein
MMDMLVDIAFDKMNVDSFIKLIRFLCKNGKLYDYYFNFIEGKEFDVKIFEFEKLKNAISNCYETPVGIRFYFLKFGDMEIPNCSIMTENYGGVLTLTISFEPKDICNAIDLPLVNKLMRNVGLVASKLGIKEYYCGTEDAADEENRFFTNNQLGEYTKKYIKNEN